MLLSLGYTMPCIYCRESFKKFCKELPIESSLSGRIELMRWLYDLRNKVNEKLIAQEKKCYNDETLTVSKQAFERPEKINIQVDCWKPIEKDSIDEDQPDLDQFDFKP